MAEPYKFVHVDPDNLPQADGPPYQGTNAECLRDALLDVIHAGLDAGLSMADVDTAVFDVVEHVAGLNRSQFRVHSTKNTKAAK